MAEKLSAERRAYLRGLKEGTRWVSELPAKAGTPNTRSDKLDIRRSKIRIG